MITENVNPNNVVSLGRMGENEYRQKDFDLDQFFDIIPGATFYILNQRPGENSLYPVEQVTQDGNHLLWPVKSADVSVKGIGHCELIMMQGDSVAKSVIFTTCILPALDGSGPAPDPMEYWLKRFNEYAQEAYDAAASALESAQSASDSAQTSSDKASEASESARAAEGYAGTASEKAGEAATSADSASGSAQRADTKAGEALASATEASDSASTASGAASGAATNALKSEGFAVGQENGVDVGSESPYYQNNAKYYSEQAAESAAAAAQHNMGVSVSGTALVFANAI